MKKLLVNCLLVVLNIMTAIAQEPLYKGSLGKYTIEMELNSRDGKAYWGRYRYEGKKEWISLKGSAAGTAIHLDEQVNGLTTGIFELNSHRDSLYGNWIKASGEKPLSVKLKFIEPQHSIRGEYKMTGTLTKDVPKEYRNDVSVGTLQISQASPARISFVLDYNSGYPHYHIAQVFQDATSTDGGKTYTVNKHIEGFGEEADSCYVSFVIADDGIHVEGGSGIGCGAGAYAVPDGFYKRQ